MKYFLDTEFVENGRTIELLSIGIACEDGRSFYAETFRAMEAKMDPSAFDPWLRENVIPHLAGTEAMCMSRSRLRENISAFVGDTPEFWAYYADYDWVVFCQIFGRMIDLPRGWPMYCRDIKQEADRLGLEPHLFVEQAQEHHALADARWNRDAYEFLLSRS